MTEKEEIIAVEESNDQATAGSEPNVGTRKHSPDSPWITALKTSPVVYANTSAVSYNVSDISIVHALQLDGNETNVPGVRVVMSHENFLRHMEVLLPYFELFTEWYGKNRPAIPDIGTPGSEEFTSLAHRIRNPKNDHPES